MNTAELISALAIDAAKLQQWLAAGLPHRRVGRGRQFDAETVQRWLIAHGHVKGPRFVGTMDEAADAVGIHPRTLATWIRQGAPGKTSEGYDLDALATWRNERYADHDPLLAGTVSPALERYRRERWKLARLERMEKERELVPRALVESWITEVLRGLRQSHVNLQRHFGPGPLAIVADGLRDASQGFLRQWFFFLKKNGLDDCLQRLEDQLEDTTTRHEEIHVTDNHDTGAPEQQGPGPTIPPIEQDAAAARS